MTKQLKEIEIPLGAKDSELCGWEYTIPEGMEATIVDNKIVVKKKESEDEKKVDNQNCIKPTNKVKSKFEIKEWKWYVCIKDLFDSYANKAFHKGDTYLSTQDGSLMPSNSNVPFEVVYPDAYFRDWTIQDAKDGDVLYSPSHRLIWIYKDNEHYYACVNMNYVTKNVATNGLIIIPNDACPATKDEQTILFARMKEADYEWDAEKKELKEIKTDRPQSTWKPSDEQIHYLSWIANIKLGDSVVEQEVSKHLNELLEDLKKLREE